MKSWLIVSSVALFGLLVNGCGMSRTDQSKPIVEFTRVPFAGPGNAQVLDTIEGRVIGARPGQQIVLYAKGETAWWVQPLADHPFTVIRSDSKWQNSTHPGTDYAALLVGPGFKPPPTPDVLPSEGVIASVITHGEVFFWHKWWFPYACVLAVAVAIFALYLWRLQQLTSQLRIRYEERLAERTRVAQELHDTLLQGIISASMQLHVALDQLPSGSPAQPALNRVLQLMGQVIEEGRNTVRGLRSSTEGGDDLQQAFLRIGQEFGPDAQVELRVMNQGNPQPLHAAIRDELYSIGREALVNAFRHAHATTIDVILEYATHHMRILVRDDGRGIDSQVLQSGREGHWGLSGMRERTERIGAQLKIWSRIDGGTEVELRVPARVAFASQPATRTSRWLAWFYPRKPAGDIAQASKRAG